MNFTNLENNQKEPQNTLKSEHLNEGVAPIIGGIYNRKEMTDKDTAFFDNFKKSAVVVNHSMEGDIAKREGLYNAGRATYIMSKIDKENKYSEKYFDCTAVYAVGVDKSTGENISFLSHQDPEKILKNTDILLSFKNNLKERLEELTNRSIPGSTDVVVLGGNKDIGYDEELKTMDMDKMDSRRIQEIMEKIEAGPFESYRKSISFLSKIIFEKLNFYPTVISGPNSNIKENDPTHSNALDLYCDTKNRHVYQIRAENTSKNNESYSGKDINSKIKDYK